jgi:Mg-chelatase subunit ChlD
VIDRWARPRHSQRSPEPGGPARRGARSLGDRRHPHRADRGNYAILVGLSGSVLLGFGALAVDSGFAALVRAQAQAIADIGAHAALISLRETGDPDVALAVAEAFVGANLLLGQPALLDTNQDVRFGLWDFSARSFTEVTPSPSTWPNAIQVIVRKTADSPNGSYSTLMMGLLNDRHAEGQAARPAVAALRTREIVLVQDVTSSFRTEMPLATEAALGFLDALHDRPLPNDRVGLVSFVGTSATVSPLTEVSGGYSGLRTTWEQLDWCTRDYYPWTLMGPPDHHVTTLPMMDCNEGSTSSDPTVDSGTAPGEGIEGGIDLLLEDPSADPYAVRVIVLISDGKPECPYPTHEAALAAACEADRREQGVEAADTAADNGIHVFAVSFNDSGDAAQSAYLASLVRGQGAFYETPDASDLPGILREIARAIPVAVVQ